MIIPEAILSSRTHGSICGLVRFALTAINKRVEVEGVIHFTGFDIGLDNLRFEVFEYDMQPEHWKSSHTSILTGALGSPMLVLSTAALRATGVI